MVLLIVLAIASAACAPLIWLCERDRMGRPRPYCGEVHQ